MGTRFSSQSDEEDLNEDDLNDLQIDVPPKYTDGVSILVIYAFIHQFTNSWIPKELNDLIILYYGYNPYQQIIHKLSFNVNYSHRPALQCYYDNKCIRIATVNHALLDIIGSIYKAKRHKHCWRFQIENPNEGEIMIGITQIPFLNKYHFYNDSNIDDRKIWGVSYKRFYYEKDSIYSLCNNYNDINLSVFKQKFYCIDILLDIDEGVVRICIVNDINNVNYKKNEAVIWNLPCNDNEWLPCIYYENALNATLRIAKIPSVWYCQQRPIWIEASYMEKLRDIIWKKEVAFNKCYVCGASRVYFGGKLFRCSRCKKRRYCSVQCQRKHWPKHKKKCKKSLKDLADSTIHDHT